MLDLLLLSDFDQGFHKRRGLRILVQFLQVGLRKLCPGDPLGITAISFFHDEAVLLNRDQFTAHGLSVGQVNGGLPPGNARQQCPENQDDAKRIKAAHNWLSITNDNRQRKKIHAREIGL